MENIEQNIPEKYRLKNWNKSDDLIFCFDSQGWPQFKQTVRDALIGFGLSYNESTNKWEISDEDPRLDTIIRRLVDDGMGYGTDEEYVTECNCFKDENGTYYCNMFTEKETPDVLLWRESKFYDGAWAKIKGENIYEPTNHYCLRKIHKTEDGKFEYDADQYWQTENDSTKFKTISGLKEEDLEYDN